MPDQIRCYRVIAESHDTCVNPHSVVAIEDSAGVLCYVSDHLRALDLLRAELTNVTAERDEWQAMTESHAAEIRRLMVERDAALAKVALRVEPYVCPGCYSTNPEEHEGDCPTCADCGAMPGTPHKDGCASFMSPSITPASPAANEGDVL